MTTVLKVAQGVQFFRYVLPQCLHTIFQCAGAELGNWFGKDPIIMGLVLIPNGLALAGLILLASDSKWLRVTSRILIVGCMAIQAGTYFLDIGRFKTNDESVYNPERSVSEYNPTPSDYYYTRSLVFAEVIMYILALPLAIAAIVMSWNGAPVGENVDDADADQKKDSQYGSMA